MIPEIVGTPTTVIVVLLYTPVPHPFIPATEIEEVVAKEGPVNVILLVAAPAVIVNPEGANQL